MEIAFDTKKKTPGKNNQSKRLLVEQYSLDHRAC